MSRGKSILLSPALILLGMASPAAAGWKLVPASRTFAVDTILVTPQSDWNQASARPGKEGRVWTQDGFALNALEFFAGVSQGAPLYKERDKKRNPMPKFDNTVLLPELADFFERSFRTQNQLTDFSITESGPVTFGGHQGLRVRYRYTLPNDELIRLGEARMAVVDGKLYLANYYAPRLHYFESKLPEALSMMDAARF